VASWRARFHVARPGAHSRRSVTEAFVKTASIACVLAPLRPQAAIGVCVVASLRRRVPSLRARLRFGGMSAAKIVSPALRGESRNVALRAAVSDLTSLTLLGSTSRSKYYTANQSKTTKCKCCE
jgi:hypothetical protein